MGRGSDVLFQHLHQADLPILASPLSSTTCPMPAVVWSQRQAGVPLSRPTSGVKPRCGDVEPGLRSTFLQDAIDLERLRQPLSTCAPSD